MPLEGPGRRPVGQVGLEVLLLDQAVALLDQVVLLVVPLGHPAAVLVGASLVQYLAEQHPVAVLRP